MSLDTKDKQILNELIKDARMPTKRLAEILNIPRVTVHSRIERMKEEGIIKQFTVITDYKKIGLPITAFVFATLTPDSNIPHQKIVEELALILNVYEVYLITGEWDILIKIHGESLDQIGKIVLEKIRSIKGIAKTITCPSFVNVKNGF